MATACAPVDATVQTGGPPIPLLTSEVFVLDRDKHLHCLSDCLDPTPDPNATYLNVRGWSRFSCALRTDHRAECWGPNGFGDLVPDELFRDVTAFYGQACGVTLEGRVTCWGEDAARMEARAPQGDWDQIETTQGGYCVWSEAGAVGCFDYRQTFEVQHGFETFHVSANRGCGLVGDGKVDCFWGNSGFRSPRYFVKALDMALYYSCVLMEETTRYAEDTLLCTGDEPVPEGSFSQLALSGGHGCVVTHDEEVVCWGGDWRVPTSLGEFR